MADTDSNLVAKVRSLTALGPEELSDDLILAMNGSAEHRAYRIMEYRKDNLVVDSD